MSEQALKQQIQNLKKHNARLVRLARDARSKLNAALDGTGLCLWQLDVPTGKLIIYNRRWGSMLGYQPKELSAQFEVWREHLHQDDKQQVLEAFYDHLQGKTLSTKRCTACRIKTALSPGCWIAGASANGTRTATRLRSLAHTST
jgi:PAS domain-containing protein